MIVLFTDFGSNDLYVGQVKARLLETAPSGTPVVDLLHTVPDFDPRAGAHLLAALHGNFPPRAVFLAVIDPEVGGRREAVVLEADDQWFVGPDNGLLSVVAARAAHTRVWRITWRPDRLAASFHGRDLFAPVAGHIAGGVLPAEYLANAPRLDVSFGPDDLPEIVYVDHYGNAMTGVRAAGVSRSGSVEVRGRGIPWALVFCEAPCGELFWYENSIGLVEIAANRASAAAALGIGVGEPVRIVQAG